MLLAHLRAGPRRAVDYLWLPLLYACGLASKETAVTLPGWLLLAGLGLGAPAAGLAAAAGADAGCAPMRRCCWCSSLTSCCARLLLERTAIDFFGGLSPGLRFLSVAKIYLHCTCSCCCCPGRWCRFTTGRCSPPAVSACGLASLSWGCCCSRRPWGSSRCCGRGSAWPRLGLCWWLLGLIPFLHLVPLPVGAAERFLYLPSVGICLALGVGFALAVALASNCRRWGWRWCW